MFTQRGEKQRSVILDPEVTLIFGKILEAFCALVYHVRWFKVFLVEPLLISSSYRWRSDRTFGLNA